MENKFKTLIGENGVKLSGGEKQRISIARALLKDSKINYIEANTLEDAANKAVAALKK